MNESTNSTQVRQVSVHAIDELIQAVEQAAGRHYGPDGIPEEIADELVSCFHAAQDLRFRVIGMVGMLLAKGDTGVGLGSPLGDGHVTLDLDPTTQPFDYLRQCLNRDAAKS